MYTNPCQTKQACLCSPVPSSPTSCLFTEYGDFFGGGEEYHFRMSLYKQHCLESNAILNNTVKPFTLC